ncbi:hypothetical protein V8G54_037306, partial [Vigna mungo]
TAANRHPRRRWRLHRKGHRRLHRTTILHLLLRAKPTPTPRSRRSRHCRRNPRPQTASQGTSSDCSPSESSPAVGSSLLLIFFACELSPSSVEHRWLEQGHHQCHDSWPKLPPIVAPNHRFSGHEQNQPPSMKLATVVLAEIRFHISAVGTTLFLHPRVFLLGCRCRGLKHVSSSSSQFF